VVTLAGTSLAALAALRFTDAAVRVDWRRVADSHAVDAYDDEDVLTLARIGDQMGLVLDAARAFQPEAEVADRYRELDRLRRDIVAITSPELRTHGGGVPAPLRDRVFERFVQGADSDAHSHGSGLGSSISRELTHTMGGDLTLRDTPDGACFEVRMRRAEAP
jgi:signal transduction histidine kinase